MMAFFKKLGDDAVKALASYSGDKAFLLGAASFAANVTAADGSIDDAEIDAAIAGMQANQLLGKSYSSSQIEEAVNAALVRAKTRGGRMENKRNIEALLTRPIELRQDVFLIGADVADQGGSIGPEEDAVLTEGAKLLNVNKNSLLG
jgi:tellurite resistance protein